MALKIIKDEGFLTPEGEEFQDLNNFSINSGLDLTIEWKSGQYWLHSDIPKERPIGIKIDSEINRHEDFFKKSTLQKELLARAIGLKGAYRPRVLDLTAGLLGDSLLMLAFGCEVLALERHPVIKFLINSALKNAHHPKLNNFRFEGVEAESFLTQAYEFDVIYFDPMFEDANVKSSPRKEMRIFRSLVGSDSDALKVFEMARAKKPKRLVVKRPRHSVNLGAEASVQYIGKSTRYDVYFSV